MGYRIRLCLVAWFLALLGGADPVSAKPPDSVACIYEEMGVEEREIAIVMLADAMATGMAEAVQGPAQKEIEELLENAHERCLVHYDWVSGQSGSAGEYAALRLLRDAIGDFIYMSGQTPVAPQAYFAANTAQMRKIRTPDEVNLSALNQHLEAAGWDLEKQPELSQMAGLFVAISAQLDFLDRDFRRGVYHGNW